MLFIRFAVFRVHECCFQAYILTIIVQSHFLFSSQLKIIAFHNKLNFKLQFLINMFWEIEIKRKGFGISYHNHSFFHHNIFFYDYNDFIKLLQIFLVIFLCWYKRYNICLISFFILHELFPGLFPPRSHFLIHWFHC